MRRKGRQSTAESPHVGSAPHRTTLMAPHSQAEPITYPRGAVSSSERAPCQ